MYYTFEQVRSMTKKEVAATFGLTSIGVYALLRASEIFTDSGDGDKICANVPKETWIENRRHKLALFPMVKAMTPVSL